ncbi:MAG TPA: methyltransferase domain-containing protein [Jatrophihabitans sp.]|nr:methyltransferase domain-containing protein [Jatrophihabitans sp.]
MSAELSLATDYASGALSKDTPEEFNRLQLLEAWGDPDTQGVLTDTGLSSGWRCLEIGAGAGSIARWLAGRCPDGTVVAVDADTRYLNEQQSDNLEWRAGDIRTMDFAASSFDLIHSRCTFCHLVERAALVDAAVGWLAPGGWLVIGDPLCLPAAASIHEPIRRFFGALELAWRAQGSDMSGWAQAIPAQLARAGLRDISVLTRANCLGEQGPYGQLSIANVKQEGGYLVDRGLLDQADVDAVLALCQDPGFMDIRSITVYASGRKPTSGEGLSDDVHRP